jgi:hypothetical protein
MRDGSTGDEGSSRVLLTDYVCQPRRAMFGAQDLKGSGRETGEGVQSGDVYNDCSITSLSIERLAVRADGTDTHLLKSSIAQLAPKITV